MHRTGSRHSTLLATVTARHLMHRPPLLWSSPSFTSHHRPHEASLTPSPSSSSSSPLLLSSHFSSLTIASGRRICRRHIRSVHACHSMNSATLATTGRARTAAAAAVATYASWSQQHCKCWKCGHEWQSVSGGGGGAAADDDAESNAALAARVLCPQCSTIRGEGASDHTLSHYAVMGLDREGEAFGIDTDRLERNFKTLQKLLHPDRFATRSEVCFPRCPSCCYCLSTSASIQHICTCTCCICSR